MNSDNTALLSLTELPAIFAAVVIVIAVVSFCVGRRMRWPGLNIGDEDDGRSENEQQRRNDDVVVVVEESPKMALWSQEKLKKEALVNWSCSVCLGECGTNADENDRDNLRLLPDCGHVFHRACVDSWLRLRPTCPLCRIPPRGVVFKSPVVGDCGGV